MAEQIIIHGVVFTQISSTSYTTSPQIVSGVSIPSLTINVSHPDMSAISALTLVAENLVINSNYSIDGQTKLTNTGAFYQDAYARGLSGVIDFANIGGVPFGETVGGFLGLSDTNITSMGRFETEAVEYSSGSPNGRVAQTSGVDFYFYVDVPLFLSYADIQRVQFNYYKSLLDTGQVQSGQRGITYETINLGLSNVLTNAFTMLAAHEMGGHGRNAGLGHDIDDIFFSQIASDPVLQ